jgi:hypothetical protein
METLLQVMVVLAAAVLTAQRLVELVHLDKEPQAAQVAVLVKEAVAAVEQPLQVPLEQQQVMVEMVLAITQLGDLQLLLVKMFQELIGLLAVVAVEQAAL